MKNLFTFRKISILIIILVLIIPFIMSVKAVPGYCVTADVTDISPSSVGIDEEFTVGIVIENCGEISPQSITFELKDISPYIDVKESLIKEIGHLSYSNSNRFLLYHMRTLANATPGTYLVRYVLTYAGEEVLFTKENNFSITVTGKEAELNLASLKTKPTLPKQGDVIELTLRIENVGSGTAKSIQIYADYPFQGVKQSFIGSLESDEDAPAIFTFIADKSGIFEFPVTITYLDDFGEGEIKTNVSISVLEKPSNIGTILFAIILLAFIGGGVYYFFKVKKSKDKIIHQLLKGDGSKKKNNE